MIEILIAILTMLTGVERAGNTCNFYIQDTEVKTGWLNVGDGFTYICDVAGIIWNGRYWTAWSQQSASDSFAKPWIASLVVYGGSTTLINRVLEDNPNVETWDLRRPRFFIRKFPEGHEYLYLCYTSMTDETPVELCWLNYQNPQQWWIFAGIFDKMVFLPSVK